MNALVGQLRLDQVFPLPNGNIASPNTCGLPSTNPLLSLQQLISQHSKKQLKCDGDAIAPPAAPLRSLLRGGEPRADPVELLHAVHHRLSTCTGNDWPQQTTGSTSSVSYVVASESSQDGTTGSYDLLPHVVIRPPGLSDTSGPVATALADTMQSQGTALAVLPWRPGEQAVRQYLLAADRRRQLLAAQGGTLYGGKALPDVRYELRERTCVLLHYHWDGDRLWPCEATAPPPPPPTTTTQSSPPPSVPQHEQPQHQQQQPQQLRRFGIEDSNVQLVLMVRKGVGGTYPYQAAQKALEARGLLPLMGGRSGGQQGNMRHGPRPGKAPVVAAAAVTAPPTRDRAVTAPVTAAAATTAMAAAVLRSSVGVGDLAATAAGADATGTASVAATATAAAGSGVGAAHGLLESRTGAPKEADRMLASVAAGGTAKGGSSGGSGTPAAPIGDGAPGPAVYDTAADRPATVAAVSTAGACPTFVVPSVTASVPSGAAVNAGTPVAMDQTGAPAAVLAMAMAATATASCRTTCESSQVSASGPVATDKKELLFAVQTAAPTPLTHQLSPPYNVPLVPPEFPDQCRIRSAADVSTRSDWRRSMAAYVASAAAAAEARPSAAGTTFPIKCTTTVAASSVPEVYQQEVREPLVQYVAAASDVAVEYDGGGSAGCEDVEVGGVAKEGEREVEAGVERGGRLEGCVDGARAMGRGLEGMREEGEEEGEEEQQEEQQQEAAGFAGRKEWQEATANDTAGGEGMVEILAEEEAGEGMPSTTRCDNTTYGDGDIGGIQLEGAMRSPRTWWSGGGASASVGGGDVVGDMVMVEAEAVEVEEAAEEVEEMEGEERMATEVKMGVQEEDVEVEEDADIGDEGCAPSELVSVPPVRSGGTPTSIDDQDAVAAGRLAEGEVMTQAPEVAEVTDLLEVTEGSAGQQGVAAHRPEGPGSGSGAPAAATVQEMTSASAAVPYTAPYSTMEFAAGGAAGGGSGGARTTAKPVKLYSYCCRLELFVDEHMWRRTAKPRRDQLYSAVQEVERRLSAWFREWNQDSLLRHCAAVLACCGAGGPAVRTASVQRTVMAGEVGPGIHHPQVPMAGSYNPAATGAAAGSPQSMQGVTATPTAAAAAAVASIANQRALAAALLGRLVPALLAAATSASAMSATTQATNPIVRTTDPPAADVAGELPLPSFVAISPSVGPSSAVQHASPLGGTPYIVPLTEAFAVGPYTAASAIDGRLRSNPSPSPPSPLRTSNPHTATPLTPLVRQATCTTDPPLLPQTPAPSQTPHAAAIDRSNMVPQRRIAAPHPTGTPSVSETVAEPTIAAKAEAAAAPATPSEATIRAKAAAPFGAVEASTGVLHTVCYPPAEPADGDHVVVEAVSSSSGLTWVNQLPPLSYSPRPHPYGTVGVPSTPRGRLQVPPPPFPATPHQQPPLPPPHQQNQQHHSHHYHHQQQQHDRQNHYYQELQHQNQQQQDDAQQLLMQPQGLSTHVTLLTPPSVHHSQPPSQPPLPSVPSLSFVPFPGASNAPIVQHCTGDCTAPFASSPHAPATPAASIGLSQQATNAPTTTPASSPAVLFSSAPFAATATATNTPTTTTTTHFQFSALLKLLAQNLLQTPPAPQAAGSPLTGTPPSAATAHGVRAAGAATLPLYPTVAVSNPSVVPTAANPIATAANPTAAITPTTNAFTPTATATTASTAAVPLSAPADVLVAGVDIPGLLVLAAACCGAIAEGGGRVGGAAGTFASHVAAGPTITTTTTAAIAATHPITDNNAIATTALRPPEPPSCVERATAVAPASEVLAQAIGTAAVPWGSMDSSTTNMFARRHITTAPPLTNTTTTTSQSSGATTTISLPLPPTTTTTTSNPSDAVPSLLQGRSHTTPTDSSSHGLAPNLPTSPCSTQSPTTSHQATDQGPDLHSDKHDTTSHQRHDPDCDRHLAVPEPLSALVSSETTKQSLSSLHQQGLKVAGVAERGLPVSAIAPIAHSPSTALSLPLAAATAVTTVAAAPQKPLLAVEYVAPTAIAAAPSANAALRAEVSVSPAAVASGTAVSAPVAVLTGPLATPAVAVASSQNLQPTAPMAVATSASFPWPLYLIGTRDSFTYHLVTRTATVQSYDGRSFVRTEYFFREDELPADYWVYAGKSTDPVIAATKASQHLIDDNGSGGVGISGTDNGTPDAAAGVNTVRHEHAAGGATDEGLIRVSVVHPGDGHRTETISPYDGPTTLTNTGVRADAAGPGCTTLAAVAAARVALGDGAHICPDKPPTRVTELAPPPPSPHHLPLSHPPTSPYHPTPTPLPCPTSPYHPPTPPSPPPGLLPVGVVTYTRLFEHSELSALEGHTDASDRMARAGLFPPTCFHSSYGRGGGGGGGDDGVGEGAEGGGGAGAGGWLKRTKMFFGARYLWTRQQLSSPGWRVAGGVRRDVPPPPTWMRQLVEDPLVRYGIIPPSFVNSVALNLYHDGSEGIQSHFDDAGRFRRPIFSLRLFSDSRLSFGGNLYGNTNNAFFVPMPRGCVTVLCDASYAANGIKHCVRPADMAGKSAALILRGIHPEAWRAAQELLMEETCAMFRSAMRLTAGTGASPDAAGVVRGPIRGGTAAIPASGGVRGGTRGGATGPSEDVVIRQVVARVMYDMVDRVDHAVRRQAAVEAAVGCVVHRMVWSVSRSAARDQLQRERVRQRQRVGVRQRVRVWQGQRQGPLGGEVEVQQQQQQWGRGRGGARRQWMGRGRGRGRLQRTEAPGMGCGQALGWQDGKACGRREGSEEGKGEGAARGGRRTGVEDEEYQVRRVMNSMLRRLETAARQERTAGVVRRVLDRMIDQLEAQEAATSAGGGDGGGNGERVVRPGKMRRTTAGPVFAPYGVGLQPGGKRRRRLELEASPTATSEAHQSYGSQVVLQGAAAGIGKQPCGGGSQETQALAGVVLPGLSVPALHFPAVRHSVPEARGRYMHVDGDLLAGDITDNDNGSNGDAAADDGGEVRQQTRQRQQRPSYGPSRAGISVQRRRGRPPHVCVSTAGGDVYGNATADDAAVVADGAVDPVVVQEQWNGRWSEARVLRAATRLVVAGAEPGGPDVRRAVRQVLRVDGFRMLRWLRRQHEVALAAKDSEDAPQAQPYTQPANDYMSYTELLLRDDNDEHADGGDNSRGTSDVIPMTSSPLPTDTDCGRRPLVVTLSPLSSPAAAAAAAMATLPSGLHGSSSLGMSTIPQTPQSTAAVKDACKNADVRQSAPLPPPPPGSSGLGTCTMPSTEAPSQTPTSQLLSTTPGAIPQQQRERSNSLNAPIDPNEVPKPWRHLYDKAIAAATAAAAATSAAAAVQIPQRCPINNAQLTGPADESVRKAATTAAAEAAKGSASWPGWSTQTAPTRLGERNDVRHEMYAVDRGCDPLLGLSPAQLIAHAVLSYVMMPAAAAEGATASATAGTAPAAAAAVPAAAVVATTTTANPAVAALAVVDGLDTAAALLPSPPATVRDAEHGPHTTEQQGVQYMSYGSVRQGERDGEVSEALEAGACGPRAQGDLPEQSGASGGGAGARIHATDVLTTAATTETEMTAVMCTTGGTAAAVLVAPPAAPLCKETPPHGGLPASALATPSVRHCTVAEQDDYCRTPVASTAAARGTDWALPPPPSSTAAADSAGVVTITATPIATTDTMTTAAVSSAQHDMDKGMSASGRGTCAALATAELDRGGGASPSSAAAAETVTSLGASNAGAAGAVGTGPSAGPGSGPSANTGAGPGAGVRTVVRAPSTPTSAAGPAGVKRKQRPVTSLPAVVCMVCYEELPAEAAGKGAASSSNPRGNGGGGDGGGRAPGAAGVDPWWWSCEGPCRRSFHTSCTGPVRPEKYEQARAICPQCFADSHPCTACGRTAPPEHSPTATTTGGLIKCSLAACGRWFHAECAAAHPLTRTAPTTTTTSTNAVNASAHGAVPTGKGRGRGRGGGGRGGGTSALGRGGGGREGGGGGLLAPGGLRKFRCPAHTCAVCVGGGEAAAIMACVRCPTAYHVRCRPEGVELVAKKLLVCPGCVGTKSPRLEG